MYLPTFGTKKSYLINKYDNRCQLASKGEQGFGKLFSISKPLHKSGGKKNSSFVYNSGNNKNVKTFKKSNVFEQSIGPKTLLLV